MVKLLHYSEVRWVFFQLVKQTPREINLLARVLIDPYQVIICFYNNTSRFSLGVFTAEVICMQMWAC